MKHFINKLKLALVHAWAFKSCYHYDYGYTEKVLLYRLEKLYHAMNTDRFHMNLKNLYEFTPNNDHDKSWRVEAIRYHKALRLAIALLRRKVDDTYDTIFKLDDILFPNFDDQLAVKRYLKATKPTRETIERVKTRDKSLFYKLLDKYSEAWWT